jgi:hypothetical protein
MTTGPDQDDFDEALDAQDQVWHWRDGSWRPVAIEDWDRFGPARNARPLPYYVEAGEHHFAVCIVSGDGRQLRNVFSHRCLIDDAGLIVDDGCFGIFTAEEIERYAGLARRHYLCWRPGERDVLTTEERLDFETLRERERRSKLLPLDVMQKLLQAIGATDPRGLISAVSSHETNSCQ